jgi:Uma2 family endonuclease
VSIRSPNSTKHVPTVPVLEPGDHLTRDEFERRFDATPGLKKAELIEGVVYMAPAVRWDNHASPHIHLAGWAVTYQASTPGVLSGDNGSVRLDLDNEPQPDLTMLIDPAHGGQAKFSDDDYVEGAPEFVAEVSGSSVSMDMNTKLRMYRRSGVKEYLVWRVLDRAIDWFVLRDSTYEPLVPQPDGIVRSEVFPGLWLDVAAMVDMNLSHVLQALQRGIDSPEHAAFVSLLASRASQK